MPPMFIEDVPNMQTVTATMATKPKVKGIFERICKPLERSESESISDTCESYGAYLLLMINVGKLSSSDRLFEHREQ